MQLRHKNTKHVHTWVSKTSPYVSKPEASLLRNRRYTIEKTALHILVVKSVHGVWFLLYFLTIIYIYTACLLQIKRRY